MKKEELYFQEIPSDELADALLLISEKAIKEHDEPIFGEYLQMVSNQYRAGAFQKDFYETAVLIDKLQEESEEEQLDHVLNNLDFTNSKVH